MKTKSIIFLFTLLCFISLSSFSQNADFNINGNVNIDALVPAFTGDNVLTTSATWTTLTASPHAVSRSCCAYVNRNDTGYIYQFGGGSGAQFTNVARYNVRTATWTNSVSVIPNNMSAASAIAIGDSLIYLFGGENTGGLGKTLRWNFVTNIWTTMAPITPNPCTDEFCYKYRDSLVYVIGGGDGLFGTNVFSDVRLYNTKSNAWTTSTSLPSAKAMLGGGIVGDTIILGPGWGAGGISTAVCSKGIITSPTTITWTSIANYPGADVTRAASFVVNKGQGVGVMISGGAVAGATVTSLAYLWNFCTQTWQTLPNNTLARSNYKGSGKADSIVYCIAGYNGSAGVGNCDIITFSSIDGTCGLTALHNNENQIPSKYSLSQNYPNPFNPSTVISFALPKTANVKLEVRDILGREVSVLINNETRQAGSHSIEFDASHLASGIYFYSITSGDFKETKKMLLIK